jgi:hypothetical protein
VSSKLSKSKKIPMWLKEIILEFDVDDCYEELDSEYKKTDIYPKVKKIIGI